MSGEQEVRRYPILICNDEDAPVAYGRSSGKGLLYCGRRDLPGSDGEPCCLTNGPQCNSCERLQADPVKRLDIFRARFPGLQDEHFISALRARGGSLDEASDYLINLGAPHVDAKLALPGSKPDGLPELLPPIESQLVRSVLEVVGQRDQREVEAALRRTENDVEAAIVYILDTSEEGLQAAVAQDLQRHDAFEEAYKEFHNRRERTIQEVTNESVPDAVAELRKLCHVSDDASDAEKRLMLATADGHCMVIHGNNEGPAADAGGPAFCAVCTNEISNAVSSKRRCRMCLLCEGCIQSKVVFFCPSMGNGGHLHYRPLHPIEPGYRQHGVCDVGAEGCLRHGLNIGWVCPCTCPECKFNVCVVCISRDIPSGFHRRLGSVDNAENDDMDSDDEGTKQGGVNIGRPIFDERAAERVAAARWEGIHRESSIGDVILGTGDVGTTARRRVEQTASLSRPHYRPHLCVAPRLETKLTTEYTQALDAFISASTGEDHNATNSTAACDVHHVEGLLHLAQGTGDDRTSRAVQQAVAAGKIDIAGTLLLAHAYAPNAKKQTSEDESEGEQLICFCGDVIDAETAPDGAVGCLAGHGMHPGCAADQLLGGGLCPTCRNPIFFPRVPAPEAKAAKEYVAAELRDRKQHEEEKARKEEELAAQGLEISLYVNDIVRISSDTGFCAKEVMKYPEKAGWVRDMASACGTVGRITEIIESNVGAGKRVAIQVRTKDLGHSYGNGDKRFRCKECNGSMCVHCFKCQRCRQDEAGHGCPSSCTEWYWTPPVLTLVCRASASTLWEELLIDKDAATATAAENHIIRLRAELKAVSIARTAVKEEMDKVGLDDARTDIVSRGLLSTDFVVALQDVAGNISPADWRRARHLLLLARQWGDSEKARAKQKLLYSAVCSGEIDSVARIVRRYNASRMADAVRWADAVSEQGEYVVENFARVALLAWPSAGAPKTGYCIGPKSRFLSRAECLDSNENIWLQVAETSPPSQGWLRIRPGGLGSPAIVRRGRSALRCFCCGDGLVPPGRSTNTFGTVKKDDEVCKGDTLLVAATLEPVQVVSFGENLVVCSFSKDDANHHKKQRMWRGNAKFTIRYRPEDLVYPEARENAGMYDEDELVPVNGHLRSRRELMLMFGNLSDAKKAWDEAKRKGRDKNDLSDDNERASGFASCTRGHLLHARCFQGALLAGHNCPAPGCTEPLWVPKVRKERRAEDACCGANANEQNAEAIRDLGELVGHSALLRARNEATAAYGHDITISGVKELKMCPVCYSGPLFNENCDDMEEHHGQCVVGAFAETESCSFQASASDIASKLMQLSATKTVADVLPKCPTHNALVMFSGCMVCGHLFTDTDWGDLPKWDPAAKAVLEVDKKKREAARLLAGEIRKEAALLQFERDALWNTWGKGLKPESHLANAFEDVFSPNDLPPMPPPAEECG